MIVKKKLYVTKDIVELWNTPAASAEKKTNLPAECLILLAPYDSQYGDFRRVLLPFSGWLHLRESMYSTDQLQEKKRKKKKKKKLRVAKKMKRGMQALKNITISSHSL